MSANARLARVLAGQFAAGGAAGCIALALLLAGDIGRLATLIAGDKAGWIAVALLMLTFAGTFGAAAMGGAPGSAEGGERGLRRDAPLTFGVRRL